MVTVVVVSSYGYEVYLSHGEDEGFVLLPLLLLALREQIGIVLDDHFRAND